MWIRSAILPLPAWYDGSMDNGPQQSNAENTNASETFGALRNDSDSNGLVRHDAVGIQMQEASRAPDQGPVENSSEGFGTVPNDSAPFGTFRNDAEEFGKVPHASEGFGKNDAQSAGSAARKAGHILTVSETAKRFESGGVPRTERSITNWCRPNKHGEARLDCFLDPNERKYFITPESVDLAIQEERARNEKNRASASESIGTVLRKNNKEGSGEQQEAEESSEKLRALRAKLQRLEVEAKFKDQWIEKYEEERDRVMRQIESISRYAGRLEGRVLELDGPNSNLLKLDSGSTDFSSSRNGRGDVDENQDAEMAA